jgi:hypothetical protein
MLLASVVGLFVACGGGEETLSPIPDGGTPDATAPDADTPDADTPDADTPDSGTCPSPITWALDPDARARATTALQTLSPTATLTWSDTRGTLESITGLEVPLPSCTGAQDIYELFFDTLEATPDLFQIDRTEWQASGPLLCSELSSFQTLHLYRKTFGPYPLHNDAFHVVVKTPNGVVTMSNFSGTYVPRPTSELLATMQACPEKADAQVEPLLRAQPFTYEKYASPPSPACVDVGSGTYTATAADTVTFEPSELFWEEGMALTLRRQRAATLVVASANYTDELLNSSADCNVDGPPNVGWIRTFDAVSGEILYDHANPDPYCTVCLR